MHVPIASELKLNVLRHCMTSDSLRTTIARKTARNQSCRAQKPLQWIRPDNGYSKHAFQLSLMKSVAVWSCVCVCVMLLVVIVMVLCDNYSKISLTHKIPTLYDPPKIFLKPQTEKLRVGD